MRASLAALAVGCLVAVAGGCPARAVRLDDVTTATNDPVAEASFRDAQASFQRGDLADARRRFGAFRDAHPQDPLVAAAELHLARIDLAEGKPAEARTRLGPLRASTDGALAEQAAFVDGLALAALGAGHEAEALHTLEPFAGRLVDRDEAEALYRTLVDLLGRMGRPGDALRHLDGLLRVVPARDHAAVRAKMAALVAACTPEQADRAYASLPRDGEAWPMLALGRARAAVDAGDQTRAREVIDELTSTLGEDDLRVVEAKELLVDREVVDERAIGAVLPLSGRGRELGAAALRGLLVAAGTLDAREPGMLGYRLAVRDDAGDPERAARAVTDLVETDHVIAIVGPLESATAEAAARAAERAGVPLLALSPRDGLTRIGVNVFRAFLTVEVEARALARHAVARLGLKRFGVLHVDAPYGVAMKGAFAAAIAELDAQATVVRARAYAPGTTTFGPVIAPLLGNAGGADLDAVLLVDAAGTVGLVAPALAAAGLWSAPAGGGLPEGARGGRPVQLLLPSAAFDPMLPRQAARYLEGAVVATGFFPEAASAVTATFVARYRERFGAEPSYVAAFAHDAFLRVREAGAKSRSGLREALLRLRPPAGASALGAFSAAREPSEAVQLVRVSAGAFAPL